MAMVGSTTLGKLTTQAEKLTEQAGKHFATKNRCKKKKSLTSTSLCGKILTWKVSHVCTFIHYSLHETKRLPLWEWLIVSCRVLAVSRYSIISWPMKRKHEPTTSEYLMSLNVKSTFTYLFLHLQFQYLGRVSKQCLLLFETFFSSASLELFPSDSPLIPTLYLG